MNLSLAIVKGRCWVNVFYPIVLLGDAVLGANIAFSIGLWEAALHEVGTKHYFESLALGVTWSMGYGSVERSSLVVDGDTLDIATSLFGAAEEEGVDELWLIEFDLIFLQGSLGGIDFVSEAIEGGVWSIDLLSIGVPPGSSLNNDGGGSHLTLGREVDEEIAWVGRVAELEAVACASEISTCRGRSSADGNVGNELSSFGSNGVSSNIWFDDCGSILTCRIIVEHDSVGVCKRCGAHEQSRSK